MEESPQSPQFEERRASLTPLKDLGGADQMEIANRAIKEFKAGLPITDEDDNQMSLLMPDSTEINTDALPPVRAVLGSRALKGTVSKPEEISFPEKTPRERELEEMDRINARKDFSNSLNNRGSGTGK